MTASSRGSRAAIAVIRSSRPRLFTPFTSSPRSYAIAATSLKTLTPEPNSQLHHLSSIPPVTASASTSQYTTKTGILLSRPPLLTRPNTSFEDAYFFYQKRLHERLALPFSRYFYFKSDTPADVLYKKQAKERGGAAARELGGYTGYGDTAWNDELLVGDGISSSAHKIDVLIKDGSAKTEDELDEEMGVQALKRHTEADRKRDEKALDRKLVRTLYLVVKSEETGEWGFPEGEVVGRENLNQAAERVLVQSAGLNMNTWIVGHAPIGHYVSPPPAPSIPGSKTFFMKGRIMAGQADLAENQYGLEDFKWLTREELQKCLGKKYFSNVRNMLAVR
ncbi:54S ribosomal protein L17, mitochondrial [Lachnellula occidentalis]|uniref:Large ribosomal subunit protein mL46 n=1 Tax=Lachnellula occidentalis TaxID=215460 RepID=A0A8H8UGR5_9HELO|nr:54S ribosomal protein L17, mitochondrial [Lachnellula occidentalis]